MMDKFQKRMIVTGGYTVLSKLCSVESIFKCLLLYFQIRDWLTLEEEMLRQQAVVVGDVDDILQVLDKQKVRLSVNMSRCVRVATFRQYRRLETGAAKCLATSQLNGVFQIMYCRVAMKLLHSSSHLPLRVHLCLWLEAWCGVVGKCVE
jgi:hypothetical protein